MRRRQSLVLGPDIIPNLDEDASITFEYLVISSKACRRGTPRFNDAADAVAARGERQCRNFGVCRNSGISSESSSVSGRFLVDGLAEQEGRGLIRGHYTSSTVQAR
jgi:hypothetical protein